MPFSSQITENKRNKNTVCPLCNSVAVASRESIPVKNVVKMYKRLLDIDVSDEFSEWTSFECIKCGDCDLCYFSPAVSGSEHFYKMLQAYDWYYLDEKNEYYFARRFVKPTDNILEIGCGKGAFAKIINCKSFLGLEFSKEAQLQAAENGVKVISETIQNHSIYKAEAYDVVCSFQVLEHVADVRSFIESAVRCLKSNGLLIISTPSADSFAALVSNFILDMPPHHVTRWSDTSQINAAKLFDLDLVELWHEPLQNIHREFYVQTICTNAVMKLLRQKNRVWNDTFIFKIVSLTCLILSKLLARSIPGYFFHPQGISVTTVFRKK